MKFIPIFAAALLALAAPALAAPTEKPSAKPQFVQPKPF